MKPLCAAPFARTFFATPGIYRNCCLTAPNTSGHSGQTFQEWWTSDQLNNFRLKLFEKELPKDCLCCHLQESSTGRSMRTEINKTVGNITEPLSVPNSWHIVFGNICNLSCWSCNENFSSTIAQHKRTLKILPEGFVDPEEQFQRAWPDLRSNILDSFSHHETIRISLLGGEPVYNRTVIQFLGELVDLGLSQRTKIEITTNGTKLNNRLMQILNKSNWNYICVFISVDAVGPKSEWLRYGSSWADVESSIDYYRKNADYLEIHTVLSILNINDLPRLYDYCKSINIPQAIIILADPDYMALQQHNHDIITVDKSEYDNRVIIS